MYTHVEADPRVEPPTKLELLLARAWLLRKTIGGVARFHAEALELLREVYAKSKEFSVGAPDTFKYANNLATSLLRCERYEEVKPFLRATIPEAARELGTEDATVLTLRINYASALISEGRSRDDLVEAVALLEELSLTARRVFGTAHPTTICIDGNLGRARSELASLTAP